MKKPALIFRFYRNYAFASLLITFTCWKILDYWKMPGLLPALLFLKLATLTILFFWVNERKRNEYFFYYNQHLSKKELWGFSAAADLLLFFVMLFLTIRQC